MLKEDPNQIITFGCRLNSFESETIKQAISQSGEKNLIVFNSCAVTAKAEKDLEISIRKARKKFPESKIIVTGCAAQIDPQKYASLKEVDLVLGNVEKTKFESYQKISQDQIPNFEIANNKILDRQNLPEKPNPNHHQDQIFLSELNKKNQISNLTDLNKIKVNDIMSVRDTAPQLVSYFENQTRAFLEIQNGCNHRCTFCIIPYGRGNSRSVGFGEIVDQCKKMIDKGHQEIVLTGVDISDYGRDLPINLSLSQMIKKLLKLIPQLPRLRLSSIDVAEIDEEFLEILANENRLTPYLHLSVQSGDDLILKRMKRRHNRQQILDFCLRARKIRPEITFGADIIAGFPTEDDQMFENSLNLIEEADLIFTHIFPYSPRLGTPASKMKQIDYKIIKNRSQIIRLAGEKQLKKYLTKQIGKEFEILIEKNNRGKTPNFLNARLVNNQDLLSKNNSYQDLSNIKENSLLQVKVVDCSEKELIVNLI
jgi:threonylcarbamoyladenosine tRNA methylthiotransferase MtaB